MRRRVLIIAAILLALVLSVPAIAIYWLCYTESGLQWLVARAENLRTVKMSFEGLEGRLSEPIRIQRFELEHARVHIVATGVETELDLGAVLLQTIDARQFKLDAIAVELRPRTTPPVQRAPRFLPSWLRIHADHVAIGKARVVLTNGRVIEAAPLRTAVSITSGSFDLEQAQVESGPYHLGGALEIIAADPTGLDGDLEWVVSWPDQPQYAGRVRIDGDLDELRVDAALARPFAVSVAGTAFTLTKDWRWQARTQTETVELTPWQPESKLGSFAATVEGEGNRDGISLGGVVTPRVLPTGPIEIAFRGTIEGGKLRADTVALKLPTPGSELQGEGEIDFDGGPPTVHLAGRWNNLRWSLEKPITTSRAGTWSLDGGMPYAFSVDGDFAAPRSISGHVAAHGDLDQESVSLRSFTAQALGGSVAGDGSVSWATDKPWRARIDARNLDPRIAHEALDGRVSFRLTGSGRGFDARGSWRLDLEELRGSVRSQPVSGRASVQREGKTIRVRDTDLRFGSANLLAQGTYGRERDLHATLVADDLAKVLPGARGSLRLRGDLEGTEQKPELAITVRAKDIEYERDGRRYGAGQLDIDADLDLSDRDPSWLRLTGTALSTDDRQLKALRVAVDGRASDHQLVVRADAGNAQLELMSQAAYARKEWTGELQRLSVNVGEAHLALDAPARFVASPSRAQIDSFCLVDAQRRACGQGRWQQDGPWSVEANANGLPLRLLAAGLPRPSEYSGLLALEARASGQPGAPWIGTLDVNFTDGVFRYRRAGDKVESLEIGTGRVQATATAEALTANVDLKAEETATFDASARAERRGTDWRKFPLSGSLQAQTRELGFVPILLPEVDRASGDLRADMKLGGTLGAPAAEGVLTLTKGEMDLYAVNLLLRDIGLELRFEGNTFRLNSSLRAGQGTAAIEGELAWVERKPRGTLKVSGQNLEVLNIPEGRVLASPNLRFRIDGRRIDVDGAVRVPTARLAPANLTGAVLPSEDEVIVGTQPTPPEERFYVTTGVHLILGDDVMVDSYGLQGKVTGGVLGYSATGEVSTGIGEITIEDGTYTAYTRELEIDRGRLIFSGGPLSDPGIDIRAIKQLPDVLAGVNVRGTLRAPRISFFSEPPLTQSQIASLLVTGRTLDSLQDESTQNAGQTRDAVLAQGGAMLAGRIGEQIGLEDVTIESNKENESSLVLGTYLSPRLYVSYGISLAEAINTFKLRYTLGDHWTIKTEAGENQSADLVFTIEK